MDYRSRVMKSNRFGSFALASSLIFLAACQSRSSTSPAFLPSPNSEITPQESVPYEGCAWVWATQPLPDLTIQVQIEMDNVLDGVSVQAEAYGENCIDGKTNRTVRFAAMETDFRITVLVDNINDLALLGENAETILKVLAQFPPSATPGPNPGYVGISFRSNNDQLVLWFPITEGENALEAGLHGEALLERLKNR